MKKPAKNSQNGFAILETMVFMMAFVILTVYTIDLFSIVHTGLVNNSAARTYLFETLQHRSNINMLRQENGLKGNPRYDATLDYTSMHFRFNTVSDEGTPYGDTVNSKVPGRIITQASATGHNITVSDINSQKNQTNIIYLKNGYGICMDSQCPQ